MVIDNDTIYVYRLIIVSFNVPRYINTYIIHAYTYMCYINNINGRSNTNN